MLSLVRDREGLQLYLEQFGVWAPAVLSFVIMLQVVVAAIPGHLLMAAGGYVYGFTGGFLISYTTTVIASMGTFYLARIYGRKVTDRFADTKVINKWEDVASRQGFRFFLFTMAIPIFPADVIPYLAGLGTVNPLHFAAANLIGRLPVAITMTLVGSHGLELSPSTIAILVIASIAMVIVVQRIGKKAEIRLQGEVQAVD